MSEIEAGEEGCLKTSAYLVQQPNLAMSLGTLTAIWQKSVSQMC